MTNIPRDIDFPLLNPRKRGEIRVSTRYFMKKIPINIMVSLMYFIGGLGMLVTALQLPRNTAASDFAGPGTFPVFLAIIIVVLSGVLILKEFRNKSKGSTEYLKLEKGDLIRLLSLMISSILYIEAIKVAGYLIATIGFTGLILWIFGFRKKVPFFVISIVFPLIIFVVFKKLLNIPLP